MDNQMSVMHSSLDTVTSHVLASRIPLSSLSLALSLILSLSLSYLSFSPPQKLPTTHKVPT